MANRRWIRDCWSLFVTNLSLVVTTKDLYGHFREAGTVFDVFVPKGMFGTGKWTRDSLTHPFLFF